MHPNNASEISKKTPNLLDSLNSSGFENKITKNAKFEYDNKLISFNSNTPLLTQFQNDSIREITQRHILITRVSVPPQFVYSILNQLIDLSKSLKYKFLNEKLFSAYTLPDDPSSIFFEGPTINEIFKLLSIFQNAFSITESGIIQFTDTSDIIQNVCNPLRTISFQIGNLIRISTPSFQNQVAQIIDFLSDKSQIIIKFCPKIDYNLLIQKGINSQIQLNNSMPSDYLAPPNIFQPEKLISSIPSVEIKQKELKLSWVDQPVICNSWDGYLFLGPLQCKKVDISHLIFKPLNLKSEEIELFQEGLTQFEKDNEAFIRNFQMSYDASYETTVPYFNLLDLNYESTLKELSEDTQNSIVNSNKINQNLEESKNEAKISSSFSYTEGNQKHQKINTEDISSDGSHIRQHQSIESFPKDRNKLTKHYHPPIDKKQHPNLKVGDYVMSTIPLENIFLKIREINGQGRIKADFLNFPCVGNSTQFVKVPSSSVCRKVRSVYELGSQDIPQQTHDIDVQTEKEEKEQSGLLRVGDFIRTNEIGVVLDNEDMQNIQYLNLNNETHFCKTSDIIDSFSSDADCRDMRGNKLFLHNKVFIQNDKIVEIMGIYEDNVLVMDNEEVLHFYKSTNVLLDINDVIGNSDQMRNSNNYDDGYNNSKNNYHGNNYSNNNNNYSNNRNNNNNNYDNDYNGNKNNYGNGYNSRHNYDNDYNKGRSSGQNGNYRNDDYNGYDHNNSSRSHFKDNGSRQAHPRPSPPPQSRHTPPPPPPPSTSAKPSSSKPTSTKSDDKPIWAQKNFVVIVPDDPKAAVILGIRNDIAYVQFIDSETKTLIFKVGDIKYPIKDLKPKPYQLGDNAVSYSERFPVYGKVKKITNNHVYLEEEKKKNKDRSRSSSICVLKKDTYRYFDWDSLEE